MQIDKVIYKKQKENFEGLTLLSSDEYNKYEDDIPMINKYWWLRSPGYSSDYAPYVRSVGSLYYSSVDSTDGSVRPALILNPESSLIVGDKFKYYDHNWTVISAKYALCDEEFCCMAFREHWAANDANDYEASDIKLYLDGVWEKMKSDEQDG